MVSDPARWVPDFAAAGASLYCFHIEAAAAAALDGRTEADALAALAAVGGAGLPAVHALVDAVHGAGMLAGLTLKPGTPVDLLLPYIKGPGEAGGVDMVLVSSSGQLAWRVPLFHGHLGTQLPRRASGQRGAWADASRTCCRSARHPRAPSRQVMTVEPGFGGQAFMPEMMDKVGACPARRPAGPGPPASADARRARCSACPAWPWLLRVRAAEPPTQPPIAAAPRARQVRSLRQRFPHLYIEVDGGLAPDTIGAAAAAGANAIVAGSAIFGAADPGAVIGQLRAAVDEAAAAAAAAAQ